MRSCPRHRFSLPSEPFGAQFKTTHQISNPLEDFSLVRPDQYVGYALVVEQYPRLSIHQLPIFKGDKYLLLCLGYNLLQWVQSLHSESVTMLIACLEVDRLLTFAVRTEWEGCKLKHISKTLSALSR